MNKSIIPNLFTSANLAFGVLGITLSATNNTFCAAICILLSLVADGLDGRYVRLCIPLSIRWGHYKELCPLHDHRFC